MTSLNDVLLAMSNIPVDDPIAEIWGRGLQGSGYAVIEYTGALPITINANGQPLLDYQISGNTEQSGTPTPENPIMPMVCGVRTENLAPFIDKWEYGYVDQNGLIHESTDRQERYSPHITIEPGATYQIAYQTGSFPATDESDWYKQSWVGIGWYNDDGFISRIASNNVKILNVVAPANARYMILSFRSFGENYNCMLIKASIPPTSYIPYGYKLPILSNTTVTNIYLGEVETTRRIKKYEVKINRVLPLSTGNTAGVSEHFSANIVPGSNNVICDRALYGNMSEVGHFYVNKINAVFIGSSTDTLDDFKSKYDGTSLWCVLEEPETGIVNEPLMKIGDYADTLSMEQADVSIPTNKGTTVIDYDGALKPSQMYIKYLEDKK